MGRRGRVAPAAALVLALGALALSGCGGEEGVAAGATVRVYVDQGLCGGAKRALAAAGGEAGELRVRVVCLDPVEGAALGSHRLKLATIGANARRATEDSSAVAFVERPGRANRFAQPIVEEATLAYVNASSGAQAMGSVLSAIEAADANSGSLRDEVRKALESS